MPAAADDPGKRGVGLWPTPASDAGLRNIAPAWYYNWSTKPAAHAPHATEFVPMIWDERSATPEAVRAAARHGKVMLGFNEPDHKLQAHMTVAEALDLWPILERGGMRLGSPAVAEGADAASGWFADFMRGAETRGLRVDFICVHHYHPKFGDPAKAAADLKSFLERVHARYRKPIWLTEFALADWKKPASADQQAAYLHAALPVLDTLPFLERYAWFALPPNPGGDGGTLAGSHLCDDRGELTPLGQIYRTASPGPHGRR
jgi:hypothetical protein